ncbi:MAG: hypothetical protein QCI38_04780, partial [Candidatus Thermoplasmatota archaeon]|nr:hypothetical protein [Candidatus Thermoplasmatota archaeon]
WWATPGSVKNGGTWCRICSYGVIRNILADSIDDMREIAHDRGGECLSKEYKNNHTKLLWRCHEGHEWWASPVSIKNQGTWCPQCSNYTSEGICRAIFEKIFGKPFPIRKPKWLVNPETGYKMELDGYCKELNLAFEYQGEQHYFCPRWYDKGLKYEAMQKRDEAKKRICKEKGVLLLEIPYTIAPSDMPCFIMKMCIENGLSVPPFKEEDFLNLNVSVPKRLEEMHCIAESHGGVCLSERYIRQNVKMHWRCSEGHEWWATPVSVKNQGSWCPKCGSVKAQTQSVLSLSINDMQKIAHERGGECLSKEYKNNRTKLLWRCNKGHEWWATPNNVKDRKTWCKECSTTSKRECSKLSIDDMRKIAHERGGECLSKEYKNNKTKLLWRCNKGHEWWAQPSSIVNQETWCPECSSSERKEIRSLGIKTMQEIAHERGGECLSKEYKNNKTKLLWRCNKGHEWWATPGKIKNNRLWCPECKKEMK